LTNIKGIINTKTRRYGFLNPTFRDLLIIDKDLARTISTDRTTIGGEIKAVKKLIGWAISTLVSHCKINLRGLFQKSLFEEFVTFVIIVQIKIVQIKDQ
jgi:hypothetical protein